MLKAKIETLSKKFLNHWFENNTNKLLILLILTDFCFMTLHYIHYRFDFLSDDNWLITEDRSFAEIFQYIKEFWITTTLFICGIKTLALIFFSWSLLYFYILLDDSLQIHERLGSHIAHLFHFHPAFGLRPVDFGEMSVYATFGIIFFVLLVFSYYKSNSEGRRISNYLFLLLAALMVFGFMVDMIDIMVQSITDNDFISVWLGIIEDGGEMLVISITAWYVLCLNPGYTPP